MGWVIPVISLMVFTDHAFSPTSLTGRAFLDLFSSVTHKSPVMIIIRCHHWYGHFKRLCLKMILASNTELCKHHCKKLPLYATDSHTVYTQILCLKHTLWFIFHQQILADLVLYSIHKWGIIPILYKRTDVRSFYGKGLLFYSRSFYGKCLLLNSVSNSLFISISFCFCLASNSLSLPTVWYCLFAWHESC